MYHVHLVSVICTLRCVAGNVLCYVPLYPLIPLALEETLWAVGLCTMPWNVGQALCVGLGEELGFRGGGFARGRFAGRAVYMSGAETPLHTLLSIFLFSDLVTFNC